MKKIIEVFSRVSEKHCGKCLNLPVPEKVLIYIVVPNGYAYSYCVDTTNRLVDIKQQVLLDLCDKQDEFNFDEFKVWEFSRQYRLQNIYALGKQSEMVPVSELKVNDMDIFILLKKRVRGKRWFFPKFESGPSEEEIWEATQHLKRAAEPEKKLMSTEEIFQFKDVKFDVRRAIIALAQQSAYVLGMHPISERLIYILKNKIVERKEDNVDTVDYLHQMGFSKPKVEFALKLNGNDYEKTVGWLITHQSDETMEDNGSSHSALSNVGDLNLHPGIVNTRILLEIIRLYSCSPVKASQDSIDCLTGLGFGVKDVVQALRKTCNDRAAACDYLTGQESYSLTDLRDGLPLDSPIMLKILELPEVQLRLCDPQLFMYFMQTLENPELLTMDLIQRDIALVQILNKYQEVKHCMGIKQFYGET